MLPFRVSFFEPMSMSGYCYGREVESIAGSALLVSPTSSEVPPQRALAGAKLGLYFRHVTTLICGGNGGDEDDDDDDVGDVYYSFIFTAPNGD